MAKIQHRDIPDAERHEVKGASSALPNSVLTSDGVGGTVFKKIEVANLSGAIPTNIAGLHLVTDGVGGLAGTTPVFARFTLASGVLTPETSNGFSISGTGFNVETSGYYWFSVEKYDIVTSPSVALIKSNLYNQTSSSIVTTALSGIVYLDELFTYGLDADGSISIWKVVA